MYGWSNDEEDMSLGFRTLIYEKRIKIRKVPVIECSHCSKYELIPLIKPHLCQLLADLRTESGSISIDFIEFNELAKVMYEMYRNSSDDIPFDMSQFRHNCKERVDILLDVFSYAESIQDKEWMDEVSKRLSQLVMPDRQKDIFESCHKMTLPNENFS